MVLTDREILKVQGDTKTLITPFDETKLRAASYDVRLDNEVTVLLERTGVVDLSNQSEIDRVYSEQYELESFVLKPGQYCLAALDEEIALPDDIIAKVLPRTRFTRIGLLVTPQFCNPSYRGRLRIGILNASGNNIKLAPNMGIAQLVFERLESVPSAPRLYRNQPTAAYQDEDAFIGARANYDMNEGARGIYERIKAGAKREK